jgi:hypothetical protein
LILPKLSASLYFAFYSNNVSTFTATTILQHDHYFDHAILNNCEIAFQSRLGITLEQQHCESRGPACEERASRDNLMVTSFCDSCLLQWLVRASFIRLLFASHLNLAMAKKTPRVTEEQNLRVRSAAHFLEKERITGGTQNIAGEITNATVLAQKLVTGGTIIKNATFLTGNVQQFGVFTGGANSINISEGIVISTGNVANVKGRYFLRNA